MTIETKTDSELLPPSVGGNLYEKSLGELAYDDFKKRNEHKDYYQHFVNLARNLCRLYHTEFTLDELLYLNSGNIPFKNLEPLFLDWVKTLIDFKLVKESKPFLYNVSTFTILNRIF
jgi:hypothetical protein